MTLQSIHEGDIVRVNRKGRVFLADVTGKEKGLLRIRPHDRNNTYFEAKASEVQAHWRKMGKVRRQEREHAEVL